MPVYFYNTLMYNIHISIYLEHPDINTNRTLILVAKTLQNLANLVEFSGSKEEYMAECNDFVLHNMARMKQFIDEISNPVLSVNILPAKAPDYSLEKELASIYRQFKKNYDAMRELAVTNNDPLQVIQSLIDIYPDLFL